MGGKSSQRKGCAAELELARILQGYGIPAGPGQAVSYGSTPDIVGVPGIHCEVKRRENVNLSAALAQARRDADRFSGLPAVFHRRNREAWRVTMELESWVELYRSYQPPGDSNHRGEAMYCVIQEVRRKRPDPYGEYRELEAYQNQWRIAGDDRPCTWSWKYTGGRFERPHLEAYKITLHHSYRENGAVRKHQYSIATMSYYDLVEYSLCDCADGRITATAEKLGMDPAELYEIVEAKLEPLRERLEADFHQSAEYIARQEHKRILDAHNAARSAFAKKYGVDADDYNRCYDVFGVLRNREYLEQIKAAHKARKQSERSYRESWRSTYEQHTSGSYSIPSGSTYSEAETAILKQFYRSLSKIYHPDLNPDKDTTEAMKMLNKLKETWGV